MTHGFQGSRLFWIRRFKDAAGRGSGDGSQGRLRQYKAGFLNRFVAAHSVRDVIEFGCGEGEQLFPMDYPIYWGFDVSQTALAACKERFSVRPRWWFSPMEDYVGQAAELALSLDVIYHLVEDDVYEDHMRTLFDAACRFVIVYSTDTPRQCVDQPPHVHHRRFTDWVPRNRPDWRLMYWHTNPFWGTLPGQSLSEFHVYELGSC